MNEIDIPLSSDDPRALLRRLEQSARRRFGQHFLTRPDLCDRMVRAAGVSAGDAVIEIGPGLGILTEAILRAEGRVSCYELDRDLAAFLRTFQPSATIIEGDAVKVDWSTADAGARVVANLPYNVGTRIVTDLLEQGARFPRIVVMLQREVVDRMLADAGDDAYGSLSIFVRSRARASFLFPVPPGAFHPPPKVDSAVILFEPLAAPEVGPAGPGLFDRVVRAAFAQRRKTIANSLSTSFPKSDALAALAKVGIDARVRAETLGIDAFRQLAAALVTTA